MTTQEQWKIIDITITAYKGRVIIIATTDRPVILYLAFSTYKIKSTRTARDRRGIYWKENLYFCFVTINKLAQTEPGETLTHTFIITFWQPDTTGYFYFFASISGLISVALSAIFSYFFKLVTTPWSEIMAEPIINAEASPTIIANSALATPSLHTTPPSSPETATITTEVTVSVS